MFEGAASTAQCPDRECSSIIREIKEGGVTQLQAAKVGFESKRHCAVLSFARWQNVANDTQTAAAAHANCIINFSSYVFEASEHCTAFTMARLALLLLAALAVAQVRAPLS